VPAALAFQALLRAQREAAPLAVRAEALRDGLLSCSQVRQAWYLVWQPASRTYAQEGGGTALPPGQGDPLEASDQVLHDHLQEQPQLDLEQLRALPCWLAGRLRRAALHHGQALALELLPGQAGLLLLEIEDSSARHWLPWLRELLVQLLALAECAAPASPLLGSDPQPALLLDEAARPADLNAPLRELLGARGLAGLAALLPVNHPRLVRACLAQNRAIEQVESQDGERILLWSFIPDAGQRRVLARCRDASREVREAREAARAGRLYRLITENTTDLIS